MKPSAIFSDLFSDDFDDRFGVFHDLIIRYAFIMSDVGQGYTIRSIGSSLEHRFVYGLESVRQIFNDLSERIQIIRQFTAEWVFIVPDEFRDEFVCGLAFAVCDLVQILIKAFRFFLLQIIENIVF